MDKERPAESRFEIIGSCLMILFFMLLYFYSV
jgi:hypothetical protein